MKQSIARTSNRLFWLLVALSLIVLGFLTVLLSMFAMSLGHDILVLCVEMWARLLAEWALSGMLLALVALAPAALLFLTQLVWDMRRTNHALAQLLTRRIPLTPRLLRLAGCLGVQTRLELVQDDRALAFCYGWRQPRILLTTRLGEMLADDELTAVLLHERFHLEQADPLKILFARCMRAALFFFPAVRDLTENYFLCQEIAADQDAVEHLDSITPLASAIYKLAVAGNPAPQELAVGAFSRMNARVEHLLTSQSGFKLRFSWLRIALSSAAAVLLVLAILHPHMPLPIAHLLHSDCPHLDLFEWF